MHIERREIPNNTSVLLMGDERYGDVPTIRRTLKMILAYPGNIILHTVHKKGVVEVGKMFLFAHRHPGLIVKEYANYSDAVQGAVKYRGKDWRVSCLVYWNGEELDTLKGLTMAVQAGIETGVIPRDRRLHEQETGAPVVSPG